MDLSSESNFFVTYFKGSFDGNGLTVSGQHVSESINSTIGLFGVLQSSHIHNLNVAQFDLLSCDYTGGLAGSCYNSNINDCNTIGIIDGRNTGGFIGRIEDSEIRYCSTESTVSGSYRSGGFTSMSSRSIISDCYSLANVSNAILSAGFVGESNDDISISNSYCAGTINMNGRQYGGFSLFCYDEITNCFWNDDISGNSNYSSGTPISTAEMQDINTFLLSGWDFIGEEENGSQDIWNINPRLNNGYPFLTHIATDIADDETIQELKPQTKLLGNYPNPFNPETTIKFSLAEDENVRIDIYNIKGQLVNTIVNEQLKAGDNVIVWSGKDVHNKPTASGVYFYRLKTKDKTFVRKMMLMK